MKKITDEKVNEIIKLYTVDQLSISKISKLFNLSSYIVSKILIEKSIKIRHQTDNLLKYSEEIKNLYDNGKSITFISKHFKLDRESVALFLKRNNIDIKNKQNEVKFDNTVFDNIDTEEKAYWLGFIFADGYISDLKDNSKHHNYQFELSLKGSDIEHLNKFNTFMKHIKNNVSVGNVKCNNNKIYERCRWSIRNKHL